MLNEICLGRYYSANSKIHTINPVAKIIILLLTILLVLLSSDIMLLVPVIILLLTMFLVKLHLLIFHKIHEIPYKVYLEAINDIKIILLLIFVVCLLLGPITSIIIIVKLTIIILLLTILTLTTSTTEIIYGLEKVLYPLNRFKIKTNLLALNIGLAFKFIPCLIDSRNNILKTQISRGINHKQNPKNYIKITKNMPFAIKIAKAKHKNIKNSMYMRLYNVDKKRCNFRMNRWKVLDIITIIVLIILLVLTILKGMIL